MDCIVRGVKKSRTWLVDFHFHFQVAIFICIDAGTELAESWIYQSCDLVKLILKFWDRAMG